MADYGKKYLRPEILSPGSVLVSKYGSTMQRDAIPIISSAGRAESISKIAARTSLFREQNHNVRTSCAIKPQAFGRFCFDAHISGLNPEQISHALLHGLTVRHDLRREQH